MHYVVFLMYHGMEPYRDIVEMNLPSSYMIEASVMGVLGSGSLGWRIYDLLLLAVSSVSMMVMLRRQGWLAGVLAAALFVLIHGRDGALMAGERDLAATALLLAAVAMLLVLHRRGAAWRFAGASALLSGLATGVALTIKPPLLPLAAGLWLWARWVSGDRKAGFRRLSAFAAGGAVFAAAASVGFLIEHHALEAFWGALHGIVAYHASIDPRTLGHLLKYSIPPLLPMLLVWLVAASLRRRQMPDPERIALILCAVGGLLSYVLQRKAFWYHRYPFLAFLIAVFMIDFAALLRGRGWGRLVGITGMATGVVIATGCLLHLVRYDRTEPPRQMLRDLADLGTPEALSGQIQCMDTIGGCIDALYAARMVQSTGFLYDCYLLDGGNPVALDLRRRFWRQMESNPPRVIVVTDSDCYEDRRSFDRFGEWPEFRRYLDAKFVLARESGALPPVRYWSHPMEAYQYRIYVRR